jgi:hypothetical protein
MWFYLYIDYRLINLLLCYFLWLSVTVETYTYIEDNCLGVVLPKALCPKC